MNTGPMQNSNHDHWPDREIRPNSNRISLKRRNLMQHILTFDKKMWNSLAGIAFDNVLSFDTDRDRLWILLCRNLIFEFTGTQIVSACPYFQIKLMRKLTLNHWTTRAQKYPEMSLIRFSPDYNQTPNTRSTSLATLSTGDNISLHRKESLRGKQVNRNTSLLASSVSGPNLKGWIDFMAEVRLLHNPTVPLYYKKEPVYKHSFPINNSFLVINRTVTHYFMSRNAEHARGRMPGINRFYCHGLLAGIQSRTCLLDSYRLPWREKRKWTGDKPVNE